ncbi:MAG: nodulation protein NfeD [Dehalococcoidia bacterium]|nr:MAG: nodulation protein NfeD [Dehalococcoidia bacterium]UCG83834.1 MAG: nodulation protein NfeD [Dehalococcoidia bacterium]
MLKVIRVSFLLIWLFAVLSIIAGGVLAESSPQIYVLRVEGTVVPAVASYIDRGIGEAESQNAAAVIIELDTPGGLLSTTENIVDRIKKAEVPVVVYVDPWAGSAGTFITLASHVAAMADGSRIGAASPVSGSGEDLSETLRKKISEDAEASIRSLAQLRGRNLEAARATVSEALSFTDGEALGLEPLTPEHQEVLKLETPYLDPPLVEIGASSLESLITQLDGMTVELVSGNVTIVTEGYSIHDVGMNTIERFLQTISDPNIAYILLTLATTGLILELINPGTILPGVVGAISLILAFYSLAVLEASWAGILFIVLAFVLFIAEVFTTTFGILTLGGLASLIMGSIILFGGGPELFQLDINWWVIAAVTVVIAAIFLFVVTAIVRSQRRRPVTGKEGLVGKVALAQTELAPTGMVLVEGEHWTARTEGDRIEPGEEVVITKVEGLKLWVTKK